LLAPDTSKALSKLINGKTSDEGISKGRRRVKATLRAVQKAEAIALPATLSSVYHQWQQNPRTFFNVFQAQGFDDSNSQAQVGANRVLRGGSRRG